MSFRIVQYFVGRRFWNKESLVNIFAIVLICNLGSIFPTVSSYMDYRTIRSEIGYNEADCALTPKIKIVSYTREGYTPESAGGTELEYEETKEKVLTFIRAPFESQVGIECYSQRPIEWSYDGTDNPPARVVDIVRRSGKAGLSCFTVTILLTTTKRATGRYRCSTIDQLHTSQLYVYANGTYAVIDANGPPALINYGLDIEIIPKNSTSTVILPCETVNPYIRPVLLKGNSRAVLTKNDTFYDPQLGFKLDPKIIPDLYDNYSCSVTNDLVRIIVKKPPTTEFSPPRSQVVVAKGQSTQLTCRSKNSVRLFRDGKIINSSNVISGDSDLKHVVSYDFVGTETGNVSCSDAATNDVLHTWNCIVISKEAEAQKSIFYDSTKDRFVCRSKTAEPLSIAIVGCSNPIECKFASKCFTPNAQYKITTPRDGKDQNCGSMYIGGLSCSATDRKELNSTATGCAYKTNTVDAGFVICSFQGEADEIVYFFKGIDQDKPTIVTDWRAASPSELIQILPTNRTTYYIGEYAQYNCTATKFIFAGGFKWQFEMNDGHYTNAKVESSKITDHALPGSGVNTNSKSTISESAIVKIEEGAKKIVCLVPLWNTTDWVNVTYNISVQRGEVPTILNPEGGTNLELTSGTNQSILCEATGIPTPETRWFRGDGAGENGEHTTLSTTGGWLHLGMVDEDDKADYICLASNVLGNTTKKFQVTVTQSAKGKFLLILGLIFAISFTSIVIVLWRKLWKNQKLVQKLMSDKEILEFHEGDKRPMLNVAEGYIRAESLGYNAGYEILERDLDIKEIIGEGEYGVVRKAKLKRNNDERDVAVKIPRGNSDTSHFKALLSELKILTYIGSIGWHENVISLLGAVTRNLKYHDVYVVVEYCTLGNLEKFLRDNSATYLNQVQNDKINLQVSLNVSQINSSGYVAANYTMTTEDLLNWCQQVTSGMEYLESKRVIHGDLATRNILLTENRTAKITDFGLAIHLYTDSPNEIPHNQNKLPWKWLAPETLVYNNFSSQSDVWAFGVTLWEIYSLGATPYPGSVCNVEFRSALINGYRMETPGFANTEIYNKILECWQYDPARRPTFADLRKFFERILHNQIYPELPPNVGGGVVYLDPSNLSHSFLED